MNTKKEKIFGGIQLKKTFGFVATTLLISLAFLPGCSTYSNSIHSIPKEVDKVITDQEGKVLFDKNEFLKQSRKWW